MKFPSLGVLQQHSVSTKSKPLPPNRYSTHHVLNFLDKNVFPPAVCPDRRYTHHSGRSGLWRCWNENRNFTSQVNTRLKLNMTRKENKSGRLSLLLSVALTLRPAPEFSLHSYGNTWHWSRLINSLLFEKQEYHETNKKTRNFVINIVSPTGRYHIFGSDMDFCLCPWSVYT